MFKRQLFYGAARERYAPMIAQGLTDQAFGDPMRRQFEVSPFAQQAQGGTFLEYVRQEYGLR